MNMEDPYLEEDEQVSQVINTSPDAVEFEESIGADVSAVEKKKLRKLLPNEVHQARCYMCNRLAARVFPPRKGLNLLEKRGGIAAVMESCKTGIQNQRMLIDTPSFNLVVTGKHEAIDGFDFSRCSPSKETCSRAITLTNRSREFVWHLLSRLFLIQITSRLNGVSLTEFRAWFDTLDDSRIETFLPTFMKFERIEDPEKKLIGGPWHVAWVNRNEFTSLDVLNDWRFEKIGEGLGWDGVSDFRIEAQNKVTRINYSSRNNQQDLIVDADPLGYPPALTRLIGCKSVTVELSNQPGTYVELRTRFFRASAYTHEIGKWFFNNMPEKFWMISPQQLRPGIVFVPGTPVAKQFLGIIG